jgi:hypothetical protein
MGADEAQTWRAIVASMPADWFSTCWFMLRALVAHIHNAEFLALALARVRAAKDSHRRIAEINKLTQMHLRESAAIPFLSGAGFDASDIKIPSTGLTEEG